MTYFTPHLNCASGTLKTSTTNSTFKVTLWPNDSVTNTGYARDTTVPGTSYTGVATAANTFGRSVCVQRTSDTELVLYPLGTWIKIGNAEEHLKDLLEELKLEVELDKPGVMDSDRGAIVRASAQLEKKGQTTVPAPKTTRPPLAGFDTTAPEDHRPGAWKTREW